MVNAPEDFATSCPRKAGAAAKVALYTVAVSSCWADLTGPG
ncbi:hypothetical protein ACWD01_00125 [Streptomyces sp. NPDC002835]|jgi:hypothetical protein